MAQKNPAKLGDLTDNFDDNFANLGYEKVPAVPITKEVDPTVLFVGSHLNTMKDYFRNKSLPGKGVFSVQPAVRVQNARRFYDDDVLPNFFSHFPSMGVLAPEDGMRDLFQHLIDYLGTRMKLGSNDVSFRVNSKDEELMALLEKEVDESQLEIDTFPEKYYRHVIGEEGVDGKNFNIAIRNAESGKFADVGNFIVLDVKQDTRKRIVEVALGGSNLLKQKEGYHHVGDCFFDFDITELNEQDKTWMYKLIDSILTSSVLLQEGLRPNGSVNVRRLLKNYLRSILYFKASIRLEEAELIDIMENIVLYGLPKASDEERKKIIGLMIEYLEEYKKDILTKKLLSDTESKVKEALLR